MPIQTHSDSPATSDILKRVRRIEIATRRAVNEVLAGEYHSVFKGRGMEFDEVREYAPGDDIRTIDWNVTARAGAPFVKRYVEERELTVMLVVDASGSSAFGSGGNLKSETAAQLCALLAFSAIRNNDRVGLMMFSDDVELFIPPKKGRKHGMRVVREALAFRPRGRGTNIAGALDELNRLLKRRAVVFLVSDFFAEGFERALSVSNRRHDLIAVALHDPREWRLPSAGLLEIEDAETGERALVDTSDAAVRDAFQRRAVEMAERREAMFRRLRVDLASVETDGDIAEPLVTLFRRRAQRY